MKLTAQHRATLAKIATYPYTFSLVPPWPPMYEPQPYEPPHPRAGKPFGLAVREKSWNGPTAEPSKNETAAQAFTRRVSRVRGVGK